MPDKDLKKRTFDFAVEVGKLILLLPYNAVNKHYFAQIVRCSSSVGANYRAAQRAKSDNDFINKLKIVEEEADETIYFLELLLSFNPSFSGAINPLIDEGSQILRIMVAAINTTRERVKNQQN